MDLRVLEYFLMVAEEGNITRAAELLHVSQPTVSRQLMDLEAEVGKPLLERNKRNIALTKDGLLFRETAREMLALYEKAIQEDADEGTLIGDITLGTGETGSFRWLAGQIHSFQKRYPAVRFHIISENADRILEDIEKGVLDLGFVHRQVSPMKFESLELPLKERWGVLLLEDHPLAGKEILSPKDLRKERLILPGNTVFQKELLRWLGAGAENRVAGSCNLIYNAIAMTRQGIGLAVCFGREERIGDGLRFVPFAGMKEASSSLVWKKRPVQPAAVERFLEQLSHAVSE